MVPGRVFVLCTIVTIDDGSDGVPGINSWTLVQRTKILSRGIGSRSGNDRVSGLEDFEGQHLPGNIQIESSNPPSDKNSNRSESDVTR